jgi:hypothetical protein
MERTKFINIIIIIIVCKSQCMIDIIFSHTIAISSHTTSYRVVRVWFSFFSGVSVCFRGVDFKHSKIKIGVKFFFVRYQKSTLPRLLRYTLVYQTIFDGAARDTKTFSKNLGTVFFRNLVSHSTTATNILLINGVDCSILTSSPTLLNSALNNKLHWIVQWCRSLFSRGEVGAFHSMSLMTFNHLYCCYYRAAPRSTSIKRNVQSGVSSILDRGLYPVTGGDVMEKTGHHRGFY